MSLVGTRPPTVDEWELYEPHHRARMVNDFDVYLAYSLRPQTPKNYKDFLDQRVHLIEMLLRQ